MTVQVLFGSSVGGGPLARLVPALDELGVRAELVHMYSPERWRSLAGKGPLGRAWARLSTHVAFPAWFLLQAIRKPGWVLVPTTNPPNLPLVAVLLRHLHGSRVAPLVYDLYPDALEAGGLLERTSLVSTLYAASNRYWMRRSSALVFIGRSMEEHCVERYGAPALHTVLETGADPQELAPAAGGERDVVVSYVGNLGAMHDWETLAGALSVLDDELAAKGVRVVIAAAGAGAERLAASTANCCAVRHGPPLGDVQWRELMTSSQLSLVTLKESAAHTCVPSKAYSALAAGSAIIAVAPERSDLAALVRRHRCGAVVSPGDVDGLVDALRQFVDDPARLDEARRRARAAAVEEYGIRHLAERWESFLRSVPAPSQPWYPVMKRALDVVVAGGTLITLSPLLAAIAAAVGVTMGRPILFSQERPGLHGRTFRLLKFRTMRTAGPGELGPEADAARLTRLGKLLRSTSLDELPSLINVLRGEMSLVGPRPLLMRYLRRYTREQARRHDVVPGLTGWAQVNGRNALSWKEKFELDVWYVDHRSFLLDLHILFRTALTVLRRDGISQDGHVTMPEFMGTEEVAA